VIAVRLLDPPRIVDVTPCVHFNLNINYLSNKTYISDKIIVNKNNINYIWSAYDIYKNFNEALYTFKKWLDFKWNPHHKRSIEGNSNSIHRSISWDILLSKNTQQSIATFLDLFCAVKMQKVTRNTLNDCICHVILQSGVPMGAASFTACANMQSIKEVYKRTRQAVQRCLPVKVV
jgi:hypothetical protein